VRDCTLDVVEKKVAKIESIVKLSSTRPFITYKLLIACDPGLTCIGLNSLSAKVEEKLYTLHNFWHVFFFVF
jgi:hypothetical protein